MSEPLLTVRDLRVEFRMGLETVHAVNGANLTVDRGQVVAIRPQPPGGNRLAACHFPEDAAHVDLRRRTGYSGI